ncbi:MAG: hypothetical protein JWP74_4070 [Marmoricola sp.]|nr:hypothetical protein [Marmoricola sp.]
MATLSAADVAKVLELVGLLHEAQNPDDLAHQLTQRLRTVIPCDLISYNDMDTTGTGDSTTFFEPELVPRLSLEPIFSALLHEHPLVNDMAENGDMQPRRMSDFISLQRLKSLDLWHEVFRPLETNYQLGMPVTTSPGRLAGIGLNRWQSDFSDRDLSVARLLQPHLALAYDHARLRAAEVDRASSELDVLTLRERQVLALVAAGRVNKDIALTLCLSVRTVEKHIENIRTKLGVRTRTEAAALLLRLRPGAASSGTAASS